MITAAKTLEKTTLRIETKSHDNEDKSDTALILDMLAKIYDCEEKAKLKLKFQRKLIGLKCLSKDTFIVQFFSLSYMNE